jgi:secretion/DNA translocation related TadE-like protein
VRGLRRGPEAERGSGTVLAVASAGVVATCLAGGLVLGGTVRASHRARAAADLAALASAAAIQSGSSPAAACARASQIAGANGAAVLGCRPQPDASVLVEVSVDVPPAALALAPLVPDSATARARAGPRP